MNDLLWRTLLMENEGTRLDFKQQQYRFANASDTDKSELLKDLLAFANAWRTETAYILLGIGAGAAGERDMLGLGPTDHMDDAAVQQFVNSKLNQDLVFSYRPYISGGQTFGVIELPIQCRPFFAKRDYGRVKKHVVYYRRGSSTAEATPTQVAQMGRDDAASQHSNQPSLLVTFADLEKGASLGREIVLESKWHAKQRPRELPEFVDRQSRSTLGIALPTIFSARSEFWKELAEHIRDVRRFARVGLAIKNESAVSAEDVRVVLKSDDVALEFLELADLPEYPESHFNMLNPTLTLPDFKKLPASPRVSHRGEQCEVVIEPGRIRPHETVWISEPILVSLDRSGAVNLQSTAYAANLAIPTLAALQLIMQVERLDALTLDELDEIHYQHVINRTQVKEFEDDIQEDDGHE